MQYSDILNMLDHFGSFSWLIAATISFFIWRYTKASGWRIVLIGSGFAVLRQIWEFLPGYKDAQSSEAVLNMYMIRYILGNVSAFLLIIGLIMLLVNHYILKTRLE